MGEEELGIIYKILYFIGHNHEQTYRIAQEVLGFFFFLNKSHDEWTLRLKRMILSGLCAYNTR